MAGGVVGVAGGAVAGVDALGGGHQGGVLAQKRQRFGDDFGAGLGEAGVPGFRAALQFAALGPLQGTAEAAEAGVEHQVDDGEHQTGEDQPEPPHRRRVFAFAQVAVPHRAGVFGALAAAEVDAEHEPAERQYARQRQHRDPAGPEVEGHG